MVTECVFYRQCHIFSQWHMIVSSSINYFEQLITPKGQKVVETVGRILLWDWWNPDLLTLSSANQTYPLGIMTSSSIFRFQKCLPFISTMNEGPNISFVSLWASIYCLSCWGEQSIQLFATGRLMERNNWIEVSRERSYKIHVAGSI